MVFWAAHVVPAMGLLAITQVTLGHIEQFSSLPGIMQVLLSAIIASFLFAPVALIVDVFFAGQIAADSDDDGVWVQLASEMSHYFVPLVLFWALINAPSLVQLERANARPHEELDLPKQGMTERDTANGAEVDFWARVPGRLGRQLVALSAELHYLRVHTTNGDTLILFSFGRAVDILQDQCGVQVHRSHWIALDQIDEVVTRDGRMMCKMIGGVSVPVSRSFRSALKAARGVGD